MAEYVSARYRPLDPVIDQPDAKPVIALDADGNEYWITDAPTCENGDWLRYIEGGGTIDPAEEPEDGEPPE